MDIGVKRKVTARVDFSRPHAARPPSPSKTLSPPSAAASLRPRAKVNTSATIVTRKLSSATSVSATTASAANSTLSGPTQPRSRARSPSPFKARPLNGAASPPSQQRHGPSSAVGAVKPKARITVRAPTMSPNTPLSSVGPSPVNLKPDPSPTRSPSSLSPVIGPSGLRQRSESMMNVPRAAAASSSSLGLRKSSISSLASAIEPDNQHLSVGASAPLRVKSKVTTLVRPSTADGGAPSSASSSPVLTNARATHLYPRPPSLSDLHNTSPTQSPSGSPIIYPITTGSPAANPHRFAAASRFNPAAGSHHYQPFTHGPSTSEDLSIGYAGGRSAVPSLRARVDPASVPLPPQSPPSSNVSFSSQSSTSPSIGSFTSQDSSLTGRTAPTSILQGINGLMMLADELGGNESSPTMSRRTSSQHPRDRERNEAKSNRKIEDLEISNRSLLTINASLEAAKHRQAKELRELRRKLRESRLALPPRAYRQLTAKDGDVSVVDVDDEDDEDSETEEAEEEEEEDGDVDVPMKNGVRSKEDEAYRRVKALVADLLTHGRRALESHPEDFLEPGEVRLGPKVLSAEEVHSWRQDSGNASVNLGDVSIQVDEDESFASDAAGPRSSTPLGANDSLQSETEVEHSLMLTDMDDDDAPPEF